MKAFPVILQQKLAEREQDHALRILPQQNNLIDFSSNDYLGFATSQTIFNQTHELLVNKNIKINGATGSRLLSGNHDLYLQTENYIAQFHESQNALIFNSGYDANIGFFSSIPQRQDIILYDELCHASIRDGIKMSHAKSYKFNHNDFEDLQKKLQKLTLNRTIEIYIVTETVFSMDGDMPNIEELVCIAQQNNAHLVVDEAHALGVFNETGKGIVQSLGFQDKIFARIMTFGKGLGCHGAAILGSNILKQYLINYARSFIYTTGLSPHAVATILIAYQNLAENQIEVNKLRYNINYFNQQKKLLGISAMFVKSKSAIQSAIIPTNEKVKQVALKLQESGFNVKPILSPTVPKGQERLRFCLHSYNTEQEILQVLQNLSNFVF